MPQMPSKEAMVEAVRKSGCSNLRDLPVEVMRAEDIYTHLMASKCPCLKRLMEKGAGHSTAQPDSTYTAHTRLNASSIA